MRNRVKTVMLLGAMTAFIILVGKLIGGNAGMVIAFVLAAGMNFFSYWYSDRMVLRMYKAREVNESQAPELYDMVKELARRAGMPMPRVYVIPEEAPNAFATGRNPEHAVVAVTEGLLNTMNRDEVMGVLAHEIAHVQNRDMLIGTIAATMAGAVMILASMARWSMIFGGLSGDDDEGGGFFATLLMAILAPIAAVLIQMAISRSQEYSADAAGARLMGRSEPLANALLKLGAHSRRKRMNANPATAHMFIVNPLSGQSMAKLFSTHPPVEERVARLRGTRPSTEANRRGAGTTGGDMEETAKEFWESMK
ncbi:MAG: zinc metalloprotease HtpX [Desulfatibacillaceae bacterium]